MRFLQIILGTIITQIVALGTFHKDCMTLSPNTVGNPSLNDRSITNDVELIKNGVDSNMRVRGVKTCTDKDGEVTGIQLLLRDAGKDEEEDDTDLIKLKLLGSDGKQCDELTFKGPLEKIEGSVT